MSGGLGCTCKGRTEDRRRNWRVLDYKCNYSTFNGRHKTPSDYSAIECRGCGSIWRTKGKYVEELF